MLYLGVVATGLLECRISASSSAHFKCCNVYAGLHQSEENAYEGFCPRCRLRVEVKIGAGSRLSRAASDTPLLPPPAALANLDSSTHSPCLQTIQYRQRCPANDLIALGCNHLHAGIHLIGFRAGCCLEVVGRPHLVSTMLVFIRCRHVSDTAVGVAAQHRRLVRRVPLQIPRGAGSSWGGRAQDRP